MTAILLLPLIDAGLRIWGFRRVYSALESLSVPRSARTQPIPDADIGQMVRLVDVAANRGPVRVTCLRRSLAAWWLLRRHGVISEIQIGVRRRDGAFEAHAWVERDGIVLNDRADIGLDFATLASPESIERMHWD